jgi:hypothetical protein
MSQPAMSRALGRLRALLRDPLLVRGSQGLVPTPAALALQPGLKRLLGEAATLVGAPALRPGRLARPGRHRCDRPSDHPAAAAADAPHLREAPLLEVKWCPSSPACWTICVTDGSA